MENKKVSEKKDSWLKVLLSYTEGSGQRLGISVILSVISIISGLMPYYCIYRGINLYIRNLNQAPMQEILRWCLYALLFYIIKIVSFSASTWISHIAAYHILEGLRHRLTDRFLKAPLGDVEGHSIGEIKSIMVEKIENMEPPIAHMIPEGSGHLLLPVIAGLENCTGFSCNRSIVFGIYDTYHDYQRKKFHSVRRIQCTYEQYYCGIHRGHRGY